MKRERRKIWYCIVLKPLKVILRQPKSFWQLKNSVEQITGHIMGFTMQYQQCMRWMVMRIKDALANFNKNYVKTEIFPRKLGKKIVESEEIRHASDYDDFYIATREEAEEQIQTAKELVSRVEEYVQARWKKESEKTVQNVEYLDMIDRIAQLSAGNGQEHELNETD